MTTPRVTVPVEPTEAMLSAAFDAFEIDNPKQYENGTAARKAIWSAMLSAAPAPEGGAVSIWSDARSLFVRYAELFAMTERYEEASVIADKAAREIEALATREVAPAEAGELAEAMERLGSAADFLEGDCVIVGDHEVRGNDLLTVLSALRAQPPAREDAVDSNAQTGESAKTLDRLCRVEDWAQAPSALRAQPPAREDAQPVAIGRNIRFTMSGEYGNAVVSPGETEGMYWTFIGQGSDDEQNAVVAEIARRLNTHPAPDALRVAVEALERIATVDMGGGFLGAQACRQVATKALSDMKANQKGGE